jgi:hypothetical protein
VVTDAVSPWLTGRGHSVALPTETATSALVACFNKNDEACAAPIVRAAAADLYLFIMVELSRDDDKGIDKVTLTGWLFDRDGAVSRADRRFCDDCRLGPLARTAEQLVAALMGGGGETAPLVVSSTPAGARVSVDGTPVGVTPLDYAVTLGSHTVTVDKDGFSSEARSIEVVAEGSRLDVALRPVAKPSSGRLPLWPLLAVGAVGVAAGGALIAVDEDDPTGQPGSPRTYTDTATAGVVVAAVGVGAIATYFIVKATRKPAPVTATVGQGGVGLAWTGRF